jgi:hypothetical protein
LAVTAVIFVVSDSLGMSTSLLVSCHDAAAWAEAGFPLDADDLKNCLVPVLKTGAVLLGFDPDDVLVKVALGVAGGVIVLGVGGLGYWLARRRRQTWVRLGEVPGQVGVPSRGCLVVLCLCLWLVNQ